MPDEALSTRFRRKLLEVLFDGRPEADAQLDAGAKSFFSSLAAERKRLVIPADATESRKLANHYSNAALGNIDVSTAGNSTIFDFGEWKSEVASRKNPDGTISFVTIAPGVSDSEFVVGSGAKPATLSTNTFSTNVDWRLDSIRGLLRMACGFMRTREDQ